MKRAILLLVLLFLLSITLASCGFWSRSYDEYILQGVKGVERKDYLTSKKLAFARVEGVVILPEMEVVRLRNGQHVVSVGIVVYSETGNERIDIQRVRLQKDSDIIFDECPTTPITFQKNDDGMMAGDMTVIDLPMETEFGLNASHGEHYQMFVDVEVQDGEEIISKSIEYDFEVYSSYRFTTVT